MGSGYVEIIPVGPKLTQIPIGEGKLLHQVGGATNNNTLYICSSYQTPPFQTMDLNSLVPSWLNFGNIWEFIQSSFQSSTPRKMVRWNLLTKSDSL